MSRLCYWIHDTSTLSILFKGLEITVIGFIFALCGLRPLLVVGGTRSSISIFLHISVYSIPCRNWIKCNDLLELWWTLVRGEFPDCDIHRCYCYLKKEYGVGAREPSQVEIWTAGMIASRRICMWTRGMQLEWWRCKERVVRPAVM